jgi:hypothetical protein
LVLRLVGRDADPARSREHVLLSVFEERPLLAARGANLIRLLEDSGGPLLLKPRYAMSYLRGPMTRVELGRAVRDRRGLLG